MHLHQLLGRMVCPMCCWIQAYLLGQNTLLRWLVQVLQDKGFLLLLLQPRMVGLLALVLRQVFALPHFKPDSLVV